jgi:enoyl-CoA hydratase/carnithine racemase
MPAMGSQLPDEDGPQLRLERPSAHVAVVVIDAPAVANALSGRFFAELAVALDTIEQDDAIRAWLLTGARLSRLVGVDKAKELLLLGELVSGTEAERIGLVNKAMPDDDLMPEALRWAATIADRPRRGVRATLGFLQLQADMSKNEALRWAQLMPGYMGLELRPFQDVAQRFYRTRGDLAADADGSRETDGPG